MLKPNLIPDYEEFTHYWNALALENGLDGIYFVAPSSFPEKEAKELFKKGYSAVHSFRFEESFSKLGGSKFTKRIKRKIQRTFKLNLKVELNIYDYKAIIENFVTEEDRNIIFYPTIYPSWDNSPRSGMRALILENSNPEIFKMHVKKVLSIVKEKPYEHRIVFLKSWNEWAEGNYMEPDLKFGLQYLQSLKSEISAVNSSKNQTHLNDF